MTSSKFVINILNIAELRPKYLTAKSFLLNFIHLVSREYCPLTLSKYIYIYICMYDRERIIFDSTCVCVRVCVAMPHPLHVSCLYHCYTYHLLYTLLFCSNVLVLPVLHKIFSRITQEGNIFIVTSLTLSPHSHTKK